jgi:repressor of nif and glnA expression
LDGWLASLPEARIALTASVKPKASALGVGGAFKEAATLPVGSSIAAGSLVTSRTMRDKTEEKRLAILKTLRDASGAVGSSKITERLSAMGHDMSERTVRFHLLELDKDGFTENLGRNGRAITAKGLSELESSQSYEKVGFLSAKIDQMTYKMNFDLAKRTGSVVMNVSLIDRQDLHKSIPSIQSVFASGYAMGTLMALLAPGEQVGQMVIPDGSVGIGTVCSISVNGVLVSHGIPTNSRFGGLLELRDHKAVRFAEFINYDGTTIDPLEVFIRSRMTGYVGATRNGNGLIGASFREVPADSRDHVAALGQEMKQVGLGGLFMLGWPGRPLLDIPVSEGRLGLVVVGGLNPVAILEEQGVRVYRTGALAGLMQYERLFNYQELGDRASIFD